MSFYLESRNTKKFPERGELFSLAGRFEKIEFLVRQFEHVAIWAFVHDSFEKINTALQLRHVLSIVGDLLIQ